MTRDLRRLATPARWMLVAALVGVNVALFSNTSDELTAASSAQARPVPTPTPASTVLGPADGPPALFVVGQQTVTRAAALLLPWRSEVVTARTDAFTNRDGTAASDIILAVRGRPTLRGLKHIVVQGGAGNAGLEGEVLETATLHLLDELVAEATAGTQVLVVGPVPATADEAEGLQGVSDALRAAAAARDIGYIDPLEEEWTGDDPDVPAQLAARLADPGPAE